MYSNIHPKALAAAITEYFYLWTPIEVSIDNQIKFCESVNEKGNVKILQAAKDNGATTTTVYNLEKQEPKKFEELYANKLSEYLSKIEFSTEKDFVEDELKKCENWSNALPVNKLLKRWIEFLKLKSFSFEKVEQKNATTLLGLTKNNDYYKSLLKNYWQKVSIASNFMGKKDFIESEIERITTKYLKPSELTVMIDRTVAKPLKSFTFDIYSKMAFDWLSCGEDLLISDIISIAENQYGQVYYDNPAEVKHTIETGTLENSVVAQLKFGVGQLLYDKFLKQQLQETVSTPTSISDNNPKGLKINQIALIHVYERKQMTRENAKGIAEKYGYTSKNSGEGLFQDYTFYCSPANRKEKPTPCTPKKLKNKIALFESVIEHLTMPAIERANDEIKILKSLFESEYQ